MIRVFVIAGSSIFINGIKMLLSDKNGICLCGYSEFKYTCLNDIFKTSPDIIILYLKNNENKYLEFVKVINSNKNKTKIIVISEYLDHNMILEYLKEDIFSFLSEKYVNKELLTAINNSKNNLKYLGSEIIDILKNNCVYTPNKTLEIYYKLNDFDKKILYYLRLGYKLDAIKSEIGSNIKDVSNTKNELINKFGVNNLAELIIITIGIYGGGQ
jgi:DNA-binding NarL/FixJ family response regulator